VRHYSTNRRLRRLSVCGCMLVSVLLGGCTAEVSQALDAPIKATSATDVVVETNLQAVLQSAQVELETTGSFADFSPTDGGVAVTSGSSNGPGQISYALVGGGGGIVLVGLNHVDRHCIGVVDIHIALGAPVLGATAPGQYSFIAPALSPASCTASSYAALPAASSGWPLAPTTNGFPA
jgi:hypothetical protein